ncbi:MAG: UDP-N-acetylglucosamine 2-epimerase (non-hydrolyzing) [Alphaproteobacteria bacterium]|nr:UDP-N-acetylglucosamine 2-epimerase (non-hydrolyzing) [Alphaproteobacteria bacterium]
MIASSQSSILLSMGTRPEIIKMAPIYIELKRRNANVKLLHTGQHSDMAETLYKMFDIVPDYHLDLKRDTPQSGSEEGPKASDLAALSATLLVECSKLLATVNPYMVLVHGDTSSAVMMALASYYHQCKIAHIEAGLRSYDEYHPFPEEKNRVMIGQLAHYHFAPTARARDNLLKESIPVASIHLVGNTIVKAAQLGAQMLDTHRKGAATDIPDLVEMLDKQKNGKRMMLVTTHRRENHETGIRSIAGAVIDMLTTYPDMLIVWPLHPNPKVMAIVEQELKNLDSTLAERLHLTKPLSYPVLLWVLKHAWIVLTDSGGIQEEAVSLGTPVLVLRKTTERQELIEAGAGALVGTQKEKILAAIKALTDNPEQYDAMCNAPNPFGDSDVVHRICNILLGVDSHE